MESNMSPEAPPLSTIIHEPSRIMEKMSGSASLYCSGSEVFPLYALMKNGIFDFCSSAVRNSTCFLLWSLKSLG